MPKGATGQPKGRPPGTINKFSAALVEKAATDGLLPHEILLAFARGLPFTEKSVNPITGDVTEHTVYPDGAMRLQAANMAAPYFAPKLAQVQHKGPIARSADQVSDDELVKIAGAMGDGNE
jgi:hypothetical protein